MYYPVYTTVDRLSAVEHCCIFVFRNLRSGQVDAREITYVQWDISSDTDR